jgi:hypothetical protein
VWWADALLDTLPVEPQLLHFAPCSPTELAALLRDRLALLPDPAALVVDDAALELCARKVAANSGDIRKALDVCQYVDARDLAWAGRRRSCPVFLYAGGRWTVRWRRRRRRRRLRCA